MYAAMSAAGKNTRLKMKNPMKLWPFRPATRAGQKAIAIQTMRNKVKYNQDPTMVVAIKPTSFYEGPRGRLQAGSVSKHTAAVSITRVRRASSQEGRHGPAEEQSP